jgi:hypothetical protein
VERVIIKETHISPPDDQESLFIVLHVINIVSKDLQLDLVCIPNYLIIERRGDLPLTSTLCSMHYYIDMYMYTAIIFCLIRPL